MEQNNKYIGTIIKGDKVISKSNKKVIFKANDNIYIKKIKEKGKVRRKKYVISESVNIICDDLNKDYVLIDSDNQPYFNKTLLILIVLGIFASIMATILTMVYNENLIFIPILCAFGLFISLMVYLFYVVLGQPKKIYKRFTETVEGEIIDYSRTEYRHDTDKTFHCNYNIMYKYKTPDGNIIHSVVNSYDAKLLYKDYPLNKKVLIKYNPLKCCESCLLDEYNSVYGGEKFVKNSSFTIMTIGKITNITTKCIDDEVDEYLKEYSLVDYIECEYTVSGVNYQTNSIFGVPHGRFKIGEEIRIFYEHDNNDKFFCDINKKCSNLDTIDF